MLPSTSPCRSAIANAEPLDFAELFAAEDRHFWFRSRNRIIATVLRQLTSKLEPGYRVLELGCGTGYVLRELERVCQRGEVVGMDLFEEGLRFARSRVQCRVAQADIYHLAGERPYHVIGMFDVLEHLPDDRGALRNIHSLLVPGGQVVLTVPAHASLWSYADDYAQHYRRYAPRELAETLITAGFVVEYRTQFMMPLFPLMWLARRLAFWKSRAGRPAAPPSPRELFLKELRIVPVLNTVLYHLLSWERFLIGGRCTLPLGTSLLAVARKDS
jgi:SAM-dependent methyltransferase